MIDIDAKVKEVLVAEVTILKKTEPLSIYDEGGAPLQGGWAPLLFRTAGVMAEGFPPAEHRAALVAKSSYSGYKTSILRYVGRSVSA